MNIKSIYISGAISSDLKNAPKKFEDAESWAWVNGWIPVNPMKLPHAQGSTWEQYMALDIEYLNTCDAIYMLPCWENSPGARLEHEIAKLKKIEIIYART